MDTRTSDKNTLKKNTNHPMYTVIGAMLLKGRKNHKQKKRYSSEERLDLPESD